MNRYALAVFICLVAAGLHAAPTASEILNQSGVKGGLVVVVGCGDPKLLVELGRRDGYLVQGLDTRADRVDAPVSELHAATGKVMRTFDETAHAEELLVTDGKLLVVAHDGSGVTAYGGKTPKSRPGFTLAQKVWKPVEKRVVMCVVADGKVFVSTVDSHQVHALSADTGKALWRHTAGARVDSAPTFYRGAVLFGSRDGYVTCLTADKGELVWRFRACPADRRAVVYDQVESVWPVHGSVLVHDDVLCFGKN